MGFVSLQLEEGSTKLSTLETAYEDDPQVLEVVTKSSDLVTQANLLVITDQMTDSQAKAALAVVTIQKRQFEKLRKSFVQPLNDHVKTINAFFKEQAAPLNEAEGIIKGKVSQYFREQQAIADKERVRQLKLAAKRQETADKKAQKTGQPVAPPVAPPVAVPTVAPPVKTTKTDAGSVTMRMDRKWEIVDESQIPRELMMPDEKKIKTMVDAKIPVPGVRVYEKPVPVVRGSRA